MDVNPIPPTFRYQSALGSHYVENTKPSYMNVSFKPSNQEGYNTLIEEANDEEENEINVVNHDHFVSSSVFGDAKYSDYSTGDNLIHQFYIGSITVVGLFILFRIMQKTK